MPVIAASLIGVVIARELNAVVSPRAILNSRGITENFGAYVTAATFNRAGTHAAFALGDGTVRISGQKHLDLRPRA